MTFEKRFEGNEEDGSGKREGSGSQAHRGLCPTWEEAVGTRHASALILPNWTEAHGALGG